ncbi:MAG: thioredoxin family protein [Bacteroidales bacterium]|jgi:small redox-active disulfide protein 2|nr:thioredoxin family protein [Bacteroidales bacterium]MCI2121742.1 thioredoxin family protein [Bacteroidales bacterium]MCI2145096.1 thioredoxin family protein [Bacteroidales bacterium]
MKIEILGTGCSKCIALFKTVQQAVEELGIDADVVKEEDLQKIMNYEVLQLPALVVDGKVAGKGVLSLQQVKEILTDIKK